MVSWIPIPGILTVSVVYHSCNVCLALVGPSVTVLVEAMTDLAPGRMATIPATVGQGHFSLSQPFSGSPSMIASLSSSSSMWGNMSSILLA